MFCIGVWGCDNGYHGYQVYFFCVGVFVMGTTGTKYVLKFPHDSTKYYGGPITAFSDKFNVT